MVTFSDSKGIPQEVTGFKSLFVGLYLSPTPTTSITTKATFIGVYLSNGRKLEINYPFAGNDFPAVGPVTLAPFITVSYVDTQYGVSYVNHADVATGTLQVESATPRLVSGTYTGPVELGGPTVKVAFKNVPVD
ncbi:hypothetical protein [Hymenobacter rubidus]|uniref:hypothetical protein n=1 Tax=Hymenobacter rubidus TaxID=1441626 RepID=UPI00191F4039|nr:hypothetical protein [Hymenobacter rubidus]